MQHVFIVIQTGGGYMPHVFSTYQGARAHVGQIPEAWLADLTESSSDYEGSVLDVLDRWVTDGCPVSWIEFEDPDGCPDGSKLEVYRVPLQ